MKYAIVYSSQTGNTRLLAQTIRSGLSREDCTYYGPPTDFLGDPQLIFVGFWTKHGTCSEEIAAFLESLEQAHVFLFGTGACCGSYEYDQKVLSAVKAHLHPSCRVVGSYLCCGKLPFALRQRYAQLEPSDPIRARRLMSRFDRAFIHPNDADLEALRRLVCQYPQLSSVDLRTACAGWEYLASF